MSDKNKYENEYTVKCDCPDDTIFASGKHVVAEKSELEDFGICNICNKKRKAKEVKKSIYDKDNKLIPSPVIEVIE